MICQIEMGRHCLFCWYRWNYWPSLFKLSFHNSFLYWFILPVPTDLPYIQCWHYCFSWIV